MCCVFQSLQLRFRLPRPPLRHSASVLEQEVGGHVDVIVGCSESFLSIHSGETHLHQPRYLDTKRIEAEFRKSFDIEDARESILLIIIFCLPST